MYMVHEDVHTILGVVEIIRHWHCTPVLLQLHRQ